MIIEVDDGDPPAAGQDRRRAMAVVFTLCLAVGAAFVGRDSPLAISEVGNSTMDSAPTTMWVDRGAIRWWGPAPAASALGDTLSLPANTTDVAATTFVYDRGGTVLVRTLVDATLSLPANTTDVQLQVFPDWLANEQLPPMQFVPVRVRAASGLAVEAVRMGDQWMVMWTERGTVYTLISDQLKIADLVRLADTLR